MREITEGINVGFAAIGGFLGWLFGGLDGFFYALIVFVIVDYFTGIMAACIKKNLSSEIGFKGIARKVTIFLLVAIANMVDTEIIKTGSAVRNAVIFFYLSNEGISILENAAIIGLPIPSKLKTVLLQINEEENKMEIKKNLTTQNFNTGTASRIKFIVIHYTANDGDTAFGNTSYFKAYRGASAHYFVDENNIYQSIEDKNIAWHCGAKSYKHPSCRNSNSLGVELCSRKNNDGTYYFKPKTVDNAVWLVKQLMAKYNVPISNVIRHYDVTGKICPEPYVRDSKAWTAFKNRLTKTTEIKEEKEMVEQITININGKNYKANRILKDGKNYICLSDFAQAGFEIGYNADTKIPSITNKPKELPITVNGKETSVEAVNINGSNFVPIRSIAAATEAFDVEYNNGKVELKTK